MRRGRVPPRLCLHWDRQNPVCFASLCHGAGFLPGIHTKNGGITMLKYTVGLLLALIAAPTIFVTGQQRTRPTPAPQPTPVLGICRPIPKCLDSERLDLATCRCVTLP